MRGNHNKGKSLFKFPHPSLLSKVEETRVLNSTTNEMGGISQEFAVFMDTAKMKALFQQELPDCLSGSWTLTDCQIQHPRYKTYLNPKSSDKSFLALAYHLEGINGQTHKADSRMLYVKAYLGARSQAEYSKACSKVSPSQQDTVLHIGKYGMVGWFFPCDPAFPWLSKVLDKELIRRYFADFLLLQQNAPPSVIKAIALTIINYRPEIRCTYRYDIKRLSGNTQTIYGKTFADEGGAEIHRRIAALYQRAQKNTESFVMTSPLGYDPTLRTIWLEGLDGKPLVDSINKQNADKLMPQLARHLVDFHRATLTGLGILSEDEQLAEIQKKSAKLQAAFPALSGRIEAILINLKGQKPNTPLGSMRLIHGDFHIQQLLLMDDNCIALFDFDELVMANPLVDVANFSADLCTLNLGKRFTEKLINRLFAAYKALSDIEISDGHFQWHLRLQLLTRAYRAYIQQKPCLGQLVDQFLEAAESVSFDNHAG